MSQEQDTSSIDLIRWTFAVSPEQRAKIETHLTDLGLEVFITSGTNFTVMWEEPEGNVEEVIEEIWELNGEPFEVTQEEFHRLGLHSLQPAEDETAQEQEAA